MCQRLIICVGELREHILSSEQICGFSRAFVCFARSDIEDDTLPSQKRATGPKLKPPAEAWLIAEASKNTEKIL